MDDLTPMQQGIEAADGPEKSKEYADVARWAERLKQGRKFDEPARKQFAKDRRYARGDSGFEVDANIAGTNIDILESHLYAKDPDFDITPGPTVRPPSLEALREVAGQMAESDPKVLEAGKIVAVDATAQGVDRDTAIAMGEAASAGMVEQLVREQVIELRKRYQKRQRETKAFAETCEIIGSRMWRDASLHRRGRPWVRSNLTIGMGVLKGSWQQRTAPSPETVTAINDLQANIARARAQKAELEDGDAGLVDRVMNGLASLVGADKEAKLANLERQLTTLQEQPEQVSSRGYVIDNVAGEDFDVAPGYTMTNHLDAPWNAHRIFMPIEDAEALALANGVTKEQMKQATRYTAREPVMVRNETAALDANADHKDADAFVASTGSTEQAEFACLREIWDRDTNAVLTMIDGVRCWIKPAWRPPATTRFYPFFVLTDSEVDGQRFAQSKVSRAAKLLDEYNRIGSAERTHRSRILPKTMINAGALDTGEADKLAKGVTQEIVLLKTTVPKADLRGLIVPVAYAAIDPGLYDRSRIVAEIERIFGTTEALAGGNAVAPSGGKKTATQIDTENSGFAARTGGQRDKQERVLGELALYTLEIARAHVTQEDAQEIAGPDALWPEYGGPDDILTTTRVDIRAGSSGKPNTAAERESFSTVYPTLREGMIEIAQLRQTSPEDLADALEKLLRLAVDRSGERLDIDELIPPAGMAPPMAAPGEPGSDPNASADTNAPPAEGAVPPEALPTNELAAA